MTVNHHCYSPAQLDNFLTAFVTGTDKIYLRIPDFLDFSKKWQKVQIPGFPGKCCFDPFFQCKKWPKRAKK